MSITADREVYALETRSESLENVCAGDFLREGESDSIDVGTGGAYTECVGGEDNSRFHSLQEDYQQELFRLVDSYSHEISGGCKVECDSDNWTVVGRMAVTEAGGSLMATHMTTDVMGVSGARITVAGDLWLAGLHGTQDRISSIIHDAATVELGGLHFEREYASGNHTGGYAYMSAAQAYTTAATATLPLLEQIIALRNLTPASSAPTSEKGSQSKPAKAPAASNSTKSSRNNSRFLGGKASKNPPWLKRPWFKHPKTATRLGGSKTKNETRLANNRVFEENAAYADSTLNGSGGEYTNIASDGRQRIRDALASLGQLSTDSDQQEGWWLQTDGLNDTDEGQHQQSGGQLEDSQCMVEADEDPDWIKHLNALYNAAERTRIEGADGGRSSGENYVPNNQGVLGVENPALEPGQRIPDVPVAGPTIGGMDGAHLVSQSTEASEMVHASAVARAEEHLAGQAGFSEKELAWEDGDSMANLYGSLRDLIEEQRVEAEPPDVDAEAEGVSSDELSRAEHLLAGIEACFPDILLDKYPGPMFGGEQTDSTDIVMAFTPEQAENSQGSAASDTSWQFSSGAGTATGGGLPAPKSDGWSATWAAFSKSAAAGSTETRSGEENGPLVVEEAANGGVRIESGAAGSVARTDWMSSLSGGGIAGGGDGADSLQTPASRFRKVRSWLTERTAQILSRLVHQESTAPSAAGMESGEQLAVDERELSALAEGVPQRCESESQEGGREFDEFPDVQDGRGAARSWLVATALGRSPGSGEDDALHRPLAGFVQLAARLKLEVVTPLTEDGEDGEDSDEVVAKAPVADDVRSQFAATVDAGETREVTNTDEAAVRDAIAPDFPETLIRAASASKETADESGTATAEGQNAAAEFHALRVVGGRNGEDEMPFTIGRSKWRRRLARVGSSAPDQIFRPSSRTQFGPDQRSASVAAPDSLFASSEGIKSSRGRNAAVAGTSRSSVSFRLLRGWDRAAPHGTGLARTNRDHLYN